MTMRKGRLVWVLLAGGGYLAFAGWGLAASRQGDREGAAPPAEYVGSEQCASCHREAAASHQAGPHAALAGADLPASLRACEACHGPASLHVAGDPRAIVRLGSLSPDEANAVCLQCHAREDPSAAPRTWRTLTLSTWIANPHSQADVSCLGCHSEHQGDARRLKQETPRLCLDCHGEMEAGDDVYQHAPVAAGLCLECHSMHGSRRPGLATAGVDAFCGNCHDAGEAGFASAHSGYRMEQTRCTACHSPHIKEQGSLGLPAYQHAPFQARQCALCHQPPAEDAAAPLVAPQKELCLRCHADLADEEPMASSHPPAREGLCLACHDPHGSKHSRPPLFKARPAEVCTTCHTGVLSALTQPHQHLPVRSGRCLTCHAGHASQAEKLLLDTPIDLCRDCHEHQHAMTHPVGFRERDGVREMVVDPRTGRMMTCATCHEVHGGSHEYLTFGDWRRDLCLACHRVDQQGKESK